MQSIIASQSTLHFFQHLEIDTLHDYLSSGLYYLVSTILNSYPSLIRFRYFSKEIALLLDFGKQLWCLSKDKGLYAQGFYGAERRGNLNKKQIVLGAVIWTVIPYLCNKLESYYNECLGKQLDGIDLSTLAALFTKIFPYLHTIISLINAIYKLLYLYKNTAQSPRPYNLLYKISGVKLTHKPRLPDEKYPVWQLIRKPGLLIVMMAHKIISWYFQQRGRENRVAAVGSVEKQMVRAPSIPSKVESKHCPICMKTIKNPTLLRISGYVFCYDCIWPYVKQTGKCPMTRLPATEKSLQTLYE